MFSKFSSQYEQMWKMIIRPTRVSYQISDLGPSIILVGDQKITVTRTDFTLKSSNSFELQCSLFQAKDPLFQSSNCLIYLHGNAGSRLDSIPLVPIIIENGFSLCCFDFAGCGLSGGEYISLGIHETLDSLIVIKYLRENFGIKEIGIWGRSMGAVTALRIASKETSLFGIIADSGFVNFCKLATEFAKENRKIGSFWTSFLMSFIKRSIKKRNNFSIYDLDQNPIVAKCTCPAFFITGKNDSFVKSYHSEEMHKNYNGKIKKIIYVPGDHNASRDKEVIFEIIKFLKEGLINKITNSKVIEESKELKNGAINSNDIIKKFGEVRGSSIINEAEFKIF